MIRAPIRLTGPLQRQLAASYIMDAAPDGSWVHFKANKRTLEQNDKLHAILSDISKQVVWFGQRLSVDKWKRLFLAALQDVEVVPGLVPGTFVPIYKSTTELNVPEMSDMIELAQSFAAEHDVVLGAGKVLEAQAR